MLLKNLRLMCTVGIVLGVSQFSQSAYLRCMGNSIDEYTEVPFEEALKILKSPYYNSTLPNFIYTFGFNGKVDGNFTIMVLNALIKLFDRNVILMNWEKEAAAVTTVGNPGYAISYSTSGVSNSIAVGKELGLALETLSNNGFNLSNTHAMGHSLGAHVFGEAGRHLVYVGKNMSRISGCDPAGPLFDKYAPLLRPLDKSSADFVDCTHTDPGGYAMNTSVSDLDIYFNYANFIKGSQETQVQTGCAIGDYDMFTANDLCSHNRCLLLWIQTWSNTTLRASKAKDYATWQADQEQGVLTDVVELGDNTKRTAFGNYYANTTGSPPYQPTD